MAISARIYGTKIDKTIYCGYDKYTQIEFDQEKSEKNRLQRGLPFDMANDFDWESSLIWLDVRRNYGEDRLCAIGYIGKRLCHITFSIRDNTVRIISLRKANYREISRYAKA